MRATLRDVPAVKRWQLFKRIGPLGTIILLHVGFFYALQSGLLRQATEALPEEVSVTFITPQPQRAPEPPKPQPAEPKTVPVVKKAVTPPPVPVVNTTPSPKAITTTPVPPAPAPAEAAPPVVTAPPAPPAPPVAAVPKTVTFDTKCSMPDPIYPSASRRMGEEGETVLRMLINEKGRPERVEVQKSSGFPRLDEAARQAALRTICSPSMEDGKAVPVYARKPITFQLE